MNLLIGAPTMLAKFVAAVMTVLLIGASGVALYYRRVDLAIACGIIGGWAAMMFFEVLRAELIQDQQQLREAERQAGTVSDSI